MSRVPPSELPAGCEHIGWVPENYKASDMLGHHKHFFDDWAKQAEADEIIGFHVKCRPVFARKAPLPSSGEEKG